MGVVVRSSLQLPERSVVMNNKELVEMGRYLFDYPKRMTLTRGQRDTIMRGLRLLVSYNQIADRDLAWKAMKLLKVFEDTEKEVREWTVEE